MQPSNPQLDSSQDFLTRYRTDPLTTLTMLGSGKDFVWFQAGRHTAFLVNSPLLLQIALTDERITRAKVTRALRYVFGEGLTTTDGAVHHEHRAILQPTLTSRAIEAVYAKSIEREISHFSDGWKDHQTVDFTAEALAFLVYLTAASLLDDDWSPYVHGVAQCVRTANHFVVGRTSHPGAGFQQVKRYFYHETLEQALDHAYANYSETTDPRRVISVLLQEGLQAKGWPHEVIRDETRAVMIAGLDTTAAGLTFALYLLAKHSHVQQTLYNDLCALKPTTEPLEYADLRKLPRLGYIVKETLRLYPTIWVLTRQATEDIATPVTLIPKGTEIFISAFVTHRDPRYFVNPLSFDPERFHSRFSPWMYFPFGGGVHHCIGENYALAVIGLAVANIVRRWELWIDPAFELGFDPGITLFPNGPCPILLTTR